MRNLLKFKSFLPVLVFMFLPSLLFAESQVGSTKNEPILNLSLVNLLAKPDEYHGKFIRLKGFIILEFEGNAIYLTKDDAQYGVTKNGLWVEFDPNLWIDPSTDKRIDLEKQFNGKFVLIEGIFNKDEFGHMGMNSGSIKSITRIMELEPLRKLHS